MTKMARKSNYDTALTVNHQAMTAKPDTINTVGHVGTRQWTQDNREGPHDPAW